MSNINIIPFKDLEVQHICKRGLKNSYISVKAPSQVIIKTPRVSKYYIQELLCEKEQWIRKQLLKLKQNPPKSVVLEDEVLLFGEILSIDSSEVFYLKQKLQKIQVNDTPKVLKAYDAFYKHFAQTYITPLVEQYAKRMDVTYKEIRYKKLKSRWGSCSSTGVLTFNTQLLKAEKEMIEYVVIHELAHRMHMNHSKAFHQLIARYMPHHKEVRKALKLFNITLEYN